MKTQNNITRKGGSAFSERRRSASRQSTARRSTSASRRSASRQSTASRRSASRTYSKARDIILNEIRNKNRNRKNNEYENIFAQPPSMKRNYSTDPDRFDLDVPNMVFHDNAAQAVVYKPMYSKPTENTGSAPSLIRAWTSNNRSHGVSRSKCLEMTTSTEWPINEGCKEPPRLLIIDTSKGDTINIDRFGEPTGGFCGITKLECDDVNGQRINITSNIIPYMNRAIKQYSPFRVCQLEYEQKMKDGKFIYNQYELNPKYKGMINIIYGVAGSTFWLEKVAKKNKHITKKTIETYFSGASQCTFVVPLDQENEIFSKWYNDGKPLSIDDLDAIRRQDNDNHIYNQILNDRPQRLLLDRPWTRFVKSPDGSDLVENGKLVVQPKHLDKSCTHITEYEGVKYNTFTIHGLTQCNILNRVTVKKTPPFIHRNGMLTLLEPMEGNVRSAAL